MALTEARRTSDLGGTSDRSFLLRMPANEAASLDGDNLESNEDKSVQLNGSELHRGKDRNPFPNSKLSYFG